MSDSATFIPLANLLIIFIPVLVVMGIYGYWALPVRTLCYASGRMVSQLLLVGYVLLFLFRQESPAVATGVLIMMLLVSSWIALRPLKKLRRRLFGKALVAICGGGMPVLALVIFGVVRLDPWYMPRYLIPLAGMIFASAMNCVSLCAERYQAEAGAGKTHPEARSVAYQAALIPLLNSFFAVGLVSIPGMMTGQILSGVSPLLAVRYQMMVMCMLLGASGVAAALYLILIKRDPA
ncbi:MAG: ABC transporter permease [Candidatus Omnitrophica bacterium]|nr:ABC transporter permease [Candidatus Omnitrophota bacterium]MCB9722256.1 ABC transporter permease [Candidatus Omnitrophota bacterium]